MPNTGYKVTVTTRTAGGTVIDGPTTSNGFSMKQIGTGQIADNSITSTKPAESFMKKVAVSDTPAGNAKGWTPDGVDTTFTISEPLLSTASFTYVTMYVLSGTSTNHFCNVVPVDAIFGNFDIACSSPPANLDALRYVVINLPTELVT